MTEEKCYSLEKDGTYCLGFPNRHALTEREIEQIFSEYGNVISVRTSGDERGFRFVRYKTLEEAEKAIENLKGHKKVRILPKKPKTQNGKEKGSSKENEKSGQQKSSGFKKKTNQNSQNQDEDWNNSFNEDASTTPSASRKKSTPYGGIYNNRGKDSLDDTESEEKVNFKAEKENLLKLLRLRATRGVVASNFGSDSASIFGDEDAPKIQDLQKEDSDLNESIIDDPFAFKSPNRQKSARSTRNQKAKINKEFLAQFTNGDDEQLSNRFKFKGNISNTELPVDDELPELMSTEELKQKSIKGSVCGDEAMKIILAEEVIVANVHEDFSELYILYLLEKFEPISITEMKTIPKKGIRYCSVYFKSTNDAIAVEKKFDNFELSGNKLIVRTPQLLVSEVGTA